MLRPQRQSVAGIYVSSANTVCSRRHLLLHVPCERMRESMCPFAAQAPWVHRNKHMSTLRGLQDVPKQNHKQDVYLQCNTVGDCTFGVVCLNIEICLNIFKERLKFNEHQRFHGDVQRNGKAWLPWGLRRILS